MSYSRIDFMTIKPFITFASLIHTVFRRQQFRFILIFFLRLTFVCANYLFCNNKFPQEGSSESIIQIPGSEVLYRCFSNTKKCGNNCVSCEDDSLMSGPCRISVRNLNGSVIPLNCKSDLPAEAFCFQSIYNICSK